MSALVDGVAGVSVQDQDGGLESLVEWVRANCTEKQRKNWDALNVARVPNADGDHIMVTKTDIKKGFKLPLPPPCILTQDIVINSEVGQVFKGLDIYSLFSLFLLWQERVAGSHWAAYLNVLPRDIDFHPITFLDKIQKDDDLELKEQLKKYDLLQRALGAQHAKLKGEWERVKQLVKLQRRKVELGKGKKILVEICDPEAASLTYDQFRWANCMIISRAFNIFEPRMMCMLPFVDSMNHTTEGPTINWKNKLVRGYFMMSAISNVSSGAELTASYHEKPSGAPNQVAMSNLKTYLMYGFVDDSAVQVPLEVPFASLRRLIDSRLLESGK
jgi:hypothetical protein